MSIIGRFLPVRHSDARDVLPSREQSLSPDPEPPKQGAMGGGVRPEFDPCGAPAIGSKKGARQ